MRPTVSVVIATRNRPGLLAEALASIAAQQIGPGEIQAIVVNDGGCDVSAVLAESGLDITAIRLPLRRGLPAARNAGLDVARGRYVAFLDDDDVMLPAHLRSVLEVLESGDEPGGVYTSCLVTTERITSLGTPPQTPYVFDYPFCPELLTVTNYIPVHSLVYVNRPVRFDISLQALEDWDLWLRLVIEHRLRLRHLDVPTVVYQCLPAPVSMTGAAAADAAALDEFGALQMRLWDRWPAAGERAARYRLYLSVMYWHAFDRLATGRPLSRFYYQHSLRQVVRAWHRHDDEDGLIDRIAQAVEGDTDAADVA